MTGFPSRNNLGLTTRQADFIAKGGMDRQKGSKRNIRKAQLVREDRRHLSAETLEQLKLLRNLK